MQFEFDKSFEKALRKLGNPSILPAVAAAVASVRDATMLQDIPNLKKLQGFSTYYRIRLHSDYRIGLELREDIVWFITIAHRKEIYRVFP